MRESPPAPSEASGSVLTPGQCLRNLLGQVGLVVFFLLVALLQYWAGLTFVRDLLILAFGANALLRLPAVIAAGRQYVAVRDGAVIIVRQATLPARPVVPAILSGVVVAVLTLTAAAVSFVSVVIMFTSHRAPWWLIVIAVNGGLWAYLIFCWYRLFTARRPPAPAPPPEPDQAAWPPPPTNNRTN